MSNVLTITTSAKPRSRNPGSLGAGATGERVLRPGGMELTRRTSRGARANALIEAKRLLGDEGLKGTVRFICNIVRDRESRERVLMMRKVFRRYQSNLAAVMMICVSARRRITNTSDVPV